MTQRNVRVREAKRTVYDIIVIGGGITGAGILRDASLRGLKVLLLEKGDFSSGTSSKSGKLVHGGLRYLQKMHFKLVFEACAERYNLTKHIAPHIVKPTMFFVPGYTSYKNPRWLIMLGVCAYTIIAVFKNIGKAKLFSKKEVADIEPEINKNGLTGAVGFYDCKAYD
ncbi:MAG: FAD-dependent oxidoreductase, partial [Deltaproteobacteria bacterium]